jgi:hypothetical protein
MSLTAVVGGRRRRVFQELDEFESAMSFLDAGVNHAGQQIDPVRRRALLRLAPRLNSATLAIDAQDVSPAQSA